MRRVLMVSPHFPPDSSAAAHRVRLLAPRLPECGWEPTVVTVRPEAYESRLDPDLAALVPSSLRVVRCSAWQPRGTRMFGFGDLGLRAFAGLWRTCASLMAAERFDALFITVHPMYPALLGPLLKRRFGVPFVIDYQDPWVGSWGLTVGGGSDGRPDFRSRVSRRLGLVLEPLVIAEADGLMAVSAGTYASVQARIAAAADLPTAEAPIGFDRRDIEGLARRSPKQWFERDGCVHISYVGTLLPTAIDTLRALLMAVGRLRDEAPPLYERLRLHFVGTSNQFDPTAPARVLPLARAIGVAGVVTETPMRVDYFDALSILEQSSAIVLLGSTEPHYTASKIYPALLAKRPILAMFHEESTVVDVLARVAVPPTVRVVTYGSDGPAWIVEPACRHLELLVRAPEYHADQVRDDLLDEMAAPALAARLARLLESACRHAAGARTQPATRATS